VQEGWSVSHAAPRARSVWSAACSPPLFSCKPGAPLIFRPFYFHHRPKAVLKATALQTLARQPIVPACAEHPGECGGPLPLSAPAHQLIFFPTHQSFSIQARRGSLTECLHGLFQTMKQLPFALTTLRLLLGPVALICALAGFNRWVYLPILLAGTLSDIFDGIIARRLGVATPALRRFDSATDVVYYLFILASAWISCRTVVENNWRLILAILLSEALMVLVCYAKFHKYPAAHSILAKIFGLCLLGGLIALLVFNVGSWVFMVLTSVALLSNGEIIAMHLLAKQPPVDVKSIFTLLDRR
jgi:CDP-diacylglycerol---glycerol-3-phosphate 3-phosphatidyltransferase